MTHCVTTQRATTQRVTHPGAPCRRVALAAGALCVALSAPAAAQTDSAAARALFAEGRSLMDAERYEEACPKLEESLRLDHGMGTQFNLAHCWEKLGRTASAWALFLDVAAAARAGNQPQREAAARERATALEPKLTRLKVTLTDPTPDTKVMRDDQEVGRAAWGTAVPVDPGDHVIRVTASGKEEWTQEVKVPPNSKTVSVTVPALVDLSVAQAPKESVPPTETAPTEVGAERVQSGTGSQKVAAFVIGGVGVAALATGTVFMVQSRQDNSAALKLCHTPVPNSTEERCEDPAEERRHRELVDDAKREQLIALIGFGVGGAALVTATLLYFTDDGRPSESALSVSPMWTEAGWGASIGGTF